MEQVERVFDEHRPCWRWNCVPIAARPWALCGRAWRSLPLSTHGGEVNRALGLFVTDSRVIDPPHALCHPWLCRDTPLTAGVPGTRKSRRTLHAGRHGRGRPRSFQPQRHVPIRRARRAAPAGGARRQGLRPLREAGVRLLTAPKGAVVKRNVLTKRRLQRLSSPQTPGCRTLPCR